MFTTYIEAYKPTIIYFRLTNSPTTFQTMMSNLFYDMMNQENMATFIDNIIVAIEMEEEHNKIVEKILKWFEENNLFVKLEKYQ